MLLTRSRLISLCDCWAIGMMWWTSTYGCPSRARKDEHEVWPHSAAVVVGDSDMVSQLQGSLEGWSTKKSMAAPSSGSRLLSSVDLAVFQGRARLGAAG